MSAARLCRRAALTRAGAGCRREPGRTKQVARFRDDRCLARRKSLQSVVSILRVRQAPGDRAMAGEARAMRSPLKLRVNVVLMRQNVAGFAKLCSELAAWGIAEITFNQLGGRDRPGFHPAHRLRLADVDVLEAQLPQIRIRLDGC